VTRTPFEESPTSQCSTIKRSDLPLLAINFSNPTLHTTGRSRHVQRIAWYAIARTVNKLKLHCGYKWRAFG
jgi:hypothetical protein